MRIGILGGTGPAGSSLGARLASIGYDVVIGSRSKYRAMEARDSLVEKWPELAERLTYGDNIAAADCDLVVIATPWDSAATTAQEHEPGPAGQGRHQHGQRPRAGRPRVPAARAAARQRGRPRPGRRAGLPRRGRPPPPAGQGARPPRRADRLRRADLRRRPGRRRRSVSEIVAKIPGCRPLDAGELSNATAIEAFTAVLLQLNVRYKTRVAPKLTGIKRDPGARATVPTMPADVRRRTRRCALLRHAPARRSSPFEPGAARPDVHVRHHAVRRHPPRPRRHVPRLRRAAAAADRPRPHRHVRAQRHRRRRPAVRQGPPARHPLPRPGRRRGGPLRGRHGGAQRAARGVDAAGVVGDPRHPRLHRHGPRPRLRLPGRRRGVLRRHQVRRRSARSATTTDEQMLELGRRARRRRRQPAQAPPARLRAVAAVGARRAVVGHDVGARAARAGTSSAARWPCASWARRSTSTAAAPT